MMTLDELQPGQIARVAEIRSEDGARLMKLASLGVFPGSLLRLQRASRSASSGQARQCCRWSGPSRGTSS